jgi:hypothetical protein
VCIQAPSGDLRVNVVALQDLCYGGGLLVATPTCQQIPDNATNANDNNKRAQIGQTRFQPPAHPRPQPSTAVQMARLAAAVTIASLPTAIKSLSSKYHQQFLQLRIDLRILESTESRLARDNFEAHSTRFKFDLKASITLLVKEHARNEYMTLAGQADLALEFF